MPQIIAFILVVGLLGLMFKLLVLALIVALVVCLIWRPKQTAGFVFIILIVGAMTKYPTFGLILSGLLITIGIYQVATKGESTQTPDRKSPDEFQRGAPLQPKNDKPGEDAD